MILAIKRFFAKRRLETAYEILEHYERRKDVIGNFEHQNLVIARVNVKWILRHWKTYGLVK
jgi:hypothetical protein